MKQSTLLLALLAVSLTLPCFGQKTKSKSLSFQILRLPAQPLEGDFKTYSVRFQNEGLALSELGLLETQVVAKYFDFQKFDQNGNQGDFELVVQLFGDNLVQRQPESFEKTVGRGDDAKTVTYYRYQVSYKMPIVYQIKDGRRTIIRESIFNPHDNIQSYKWGEYKTAKALKDAWGGKGMTELNRKLKEELTNQLARLGAVLKNEIDQRYIDTQTAFFTIKKPEKFNLEEMDKALEVANKALAKTLSGTPITNIESDMEPALTIWKETAASNSASDKKRGIVHFACQYNLAKSYWLMGQYDLSREYINKAEKVGKRGGQLKTLSNAIADAETRIDVNENLQFIHQGQYDPASAEAAFAGNNTANDYIMTWEQDTVFGTITYDIDMFGIDKIKVEPVGEAMRVFNPDEVAIIVQANRTYQPLAARPVISIAPAFVPLELVYYTEKMILYRLDLEGEYEYFIRKAEKGADPVNVSGRKFSNFNKGLATYFENCPAIKEKAEAGEYKRSETTLRGIVDEYTACMN